MNALTYFFFNLGLHNVLLFLVAFLLGLLLGWVLWAKYRKQINGYAKRRKDNEAKISQLEAEIRSAQKREAEVCSNDSSELDAALAACKQQCADLEAERSGLQTEVASLSAAASTAAAAAVVSAPVETELPLAADAKSDEDPEAFFADALASGKMTDDEQYGLLYNSAPDEVDDLTRIKGVAGVLNEKLNSYGVYTYRQIAIWSPQMCEDFSNRISFKGRIQRDNWIGQCKQFHEEKYNEVI